MNPIYQDSNAYQIGRRDERNEWAGKVFGIIEKSFKEAHEEAIEVACSYLYAKTKMTATEISKFRKAMEEHLLQRRKPFSLFGLYPFQNILRILRRRNRFGNSNGDKTRNNHRHLR